MADAIGELRELKDRRSPGRLNQKAGGRPILRVKTAGHRRLR